MPKNKTKKQEKRKYHIIRAFLDFFLYMYLLKLYSGGTADKQSAKTNMTNARNVSFIQTF